MGSDVISTALEIPLSELESWLETEAARILKPLNDQGRKLVDKIDERIRDARESCEKLAEEGKRELERGKAIHKARVTEKLSKYFLKQIDKVVLPEKPSFSEMERLHKDLKGVFSSIIRERSMWFHRISPLFIITRKRVDLAFSRIAGPISELDAFLSKEYSTAKTIENLLSEINETTRLLNKLRENEKHITDTTERLQNLLRTLEEISGSLESAKESAELRNIAKVNSQVQQLRTQIKHELRHLQKPLKKFKNLGAGLSSEEASKLAQYLENPFKAFATEAPDYPTLKNILRKVGIAMDEGKLKLKTSRQERARGDIDSVLNRNTLSTLHGKCVHVYSLSQQLKSSAEAQEAQNTVSQLQQRLEEIQKQQETAEARLSTLEEESKRLTEKAVEKKTTLEKGIEETFNKRVTIKL